MIRIAHFIKVMPVFSRFDKDGSLYGFESKYSCHIGYAYKDGEIMIFDEESAIVGSFDEGRQIASMIKNKVFREEMLALCDDIDYLKRFWR